MTSQANPSEFFEESINVARDNIGKAIEIMERTGTAHTDRLLRIAEIQAEMAKATALVMIAQALQESGIPGMGSMRAQAVRGLSHEE